MWGWTKVLYPIWQYLTDQAVEDRPSWNSATWLAPRTPDGGASQRFPPSSSWCSTPVWDPSVQTVRSCFGDSRCKHQFGCSKVYNLRCGVQNPSFFVGTLEVWGWFALQQLNPKSWLLLPLPCLMRQDLNLVAPILQYQSFSQVLCVFQSQYVGCIFGIFWLCLVAWLD